MLFAKPRTLSFSSLIPVAIVLVIFAQVAKASKDQKSQGATLFQDKGCAHCHGPSGFGGTDSGPDLSNVRKELRPAEIAQQIRDGGNNMPPFGDALTSDEITSLVVYLHSKRKPPPGWVKPPSAPAPTPAPKSDPD
jgi:ubiquinol-cytochrome c reductase cytochrome b subunit